MNCSVSPKRIAALETVDRMDAETRECVHEFGLPIVTACHMAGVTRPRIIQHLVREIWAGARQQSQSGGATSTLDWLLVQSGSNLSSKTLGRLLAENNMVIVSAEPSRPMIEASLKEVSGGKVRCTKEEKHKRRLRAALRAAMPRVSS